MRKFIRLFYLIFLLIILLHNTVNYAVATGDNPTECSGGLGTSTFASSWKMYGFAWENNSILINSGNNNTLCTVFYDINNRSLIDYNLSTNTYTLNNISALAILSSSPTDSATLYINNTNLKFGNFNGNRIKIRNEGNLYINNSNITSLNTSIRGFIFSHQSIEYGGRPKYNLTINNSHISYLGSTEVDITYGNMYTISILSPYGYNSGRLRILNNYFLNNILTIGTGTDTDVIISGNTFNGDSSPYPIYLQGGGTFANNLIKNYSSPSQAVVTLWDNSIVTGNTFTENALTHGGIQSKEGNGGNIISNNIFYNNQGDGSRISIGASHRWIWSYLENNTINESSCCVGTGILISGNGYNNGSGNGWDVYGIIRNNTIINSSIGIIYYHYGSFGHRAQRNVRVYNNVVSTSQKGIVVEGASRTGFDPFNSVAYNNTIKSSTIADIVIGDYFESENPTPRFINTGYSTVLMTSQSKRIWDGSWVYVYNTGYFNNYVLLNINVTDTNGNLIPGATININNTVDSGYPSINISGLNKTVFTTGTDGHTLLPSENESNSPAILAFWKNRTYQKNMSYLISVFDPNHLYTSTSTPTLLYPNGTLQQLSPLATATVSPNESWYRPDPNTYQNTTVITINRTRTNITLRFPNGSITVSNATQTSLNATSDYDQSYVIINNTIPGYANKDVKFYVDDAFYTNKTANATGFISFNYTGAWSSHTFKWVVNFPRYDINKDGVVNILDLNYIGQHLNESTTPPYPDYDVDQNDIVDGSDLLIVALHFGEITV